MVEMNDKLQAALSEYERAHERGTAARTHAYASQARLTKDELDAAQKLYKTVVDILTSNL